VIDHEAAAQKAAEERLAYCNAQLYEDEIEDGNELPAPGEGQEPCGPFCGCDTCIVREVLDAAWPHLLELAREEARKPALTAVS
jgi:hypothetical protein